jgi:hypothetical protein
MFEIPLSALEGYCRDAFCLRRASSNRHKGYGRLPTAWVLLTVDFDRLTVLCQDVSQAESQAIGCFIDETLRRLPIRGGARSYMFPTWSTRRGFEIVLRFRGAHAPV